MDKKADAFSIRLLTRTDGLRSLTEEELAMLPRELEMSMRKKNGVIQLYLLRAKKSTSQGVLILKFSSQLSNRLDSQQHHSALALVTRTGSKTCPRLAKVIRLHIAIKKRTRKTVEEDARISTSLLKQRTSLATRFHAKNGTTALLLLQKIKMMVP